MPPRVPPRRLALCGGGVRGIAHVGVMKALQEAGLLKCIKELIGISAGSLFSLLWVLEYSLDEIERLALQLDFTLLRQIDPESIFSFPVTFGLDSGQGLEALISSILRQKGFTMETTFAEIARKYPLALRCYATELQTLKIREFGTLATPNESVGFAVRCSMSLPLLYQPVKDPYSDVLLVDGGLLNNLPMVFLKEHELFDTWGVLFYSGERSYAKPVEDLTTFFKYIYDGITFMRSKMFLNQFHERVLCIPFDETGALNFEPTLENRKSLIQLAFESTKKFLKAPHTKVKRRYSAA